jgi:uncharacterized membrane protein YbhN (UPF0104 family)
VAIWIAATAIVALAVVQIASSPPPLGRIGHPDPLWLAAAAVAECVSLVAYALIVRELLATWGITGRTSALLRATVGGIAMGATLPAGQALSVAYWYRQLRREGAAPRLAGFALTAAGIAGAVSLAVLLVVGVAVAGDAGPLAGARWPVLAAGGTLVALRLVLHRRLAAVGRRLLRRWSLAIPGDPDGGGRRLIAIVVLAYANWLLDCASLVAALTAVGAHVPAQSVLLTYALSQIVNQIPLLPGGGGTVEISLSIGFAAFGHTSGEVFAGILLFRLISCWGLVPIGWLAVALENRGIGGSWSREAVKVRPLPISS